MDPSSNSTTLNASKLPATGKTSHKQPVPSSTFSGQIVPNLYAESSTNDEYGNTSMVELVLNIVFQISLPRPPPAVGSYSIHYHAGLPIRHKFPFDRPPAISSVLPNAMDRREEMESRISEHLDSSIKFAEAVGHNFTKVVVDIFYLKAQVCWDYVIFVCGRHKQYPPVDISDEAGEDTCSVCYEAMGDHQRLVALQCNHWFHAQCVLGRLRTRNSCPSCQSNQDQVIRCGYQLPRASDCNRYSGPLLE